MSTSKRDLTRAVSIFYERVLAQGQLDLVPQVFSASYVAYVPRFCRGQLEAGLSALVSRLGAVVPLVSDVKRTITDGDVVFVHVKYPGPVPIAAVDIFEFDAEDKICRHWNVRQALMHDASRVDERFADAAGPDRHVHLDRRVLEKRIREMLTQMWAKGDLDLVPSFYSQQYVQHNLDMPGGYQRIRQVVEKDIRGYISKTGAPFPIEIHRIGVEGNLAFVHSSIFMAGINRNDGDKSTNVDIFRVDESGKMIEHWDVLQMESEPLPNEATLF